MDDFYSKDDSSPWFEALAGLSFAAMLTFGFIFGGSGGAVGRNPPTDLYGCYAARGGPDIEITPTTLTVLQPSQIRITSRLAYHKGWAFDIDHWLDVRIQSPDRFEIEATWPNGEHIFLAPEGEFAPPIGQFKLYSRKDSLAVIYRKIGDSCPRTASGPDSH
ncbi:hypothetical protein [Novosphingobium sp.]|uniref:hypothetical protein n=1 Tax=Novosphingobium sp. TaxID=1874826 RepID=UPI00286C2154|nr:hypothetical protein [Novosphingobium sp.]